MKLNTINTIENAQSLYKSDKGAQLSNLTPLSGDEQSLIQEQFPRGSNRRLELYMASGGTKVEVPEAKGRNFDFRV